MKKLFLIMIAVLNITCLYTSTPASDLPEGQLAWKFQTTGAIASSPVYSEGLIYFGSGRSLYAVDTSGKEKFRVKTGGNISCRPAVDKSNVYFQSADGFLYCLNKTSGKENWKIQIEQNVLLRLYDYWDYYQSSPVIEDNILYIGSSDTHLYAVSVPAGTVLWKYKTGHIIRSTPVCHGGTVYVGSFDGRFYALNAKTGKEIWNYKIEKPNFSYFGEIQSSAVISGGRVIFGSRDGVLHALDISNGKELWGYSHEGSWVISTPVIHDSMVVAGSSDAHFINAVNINSGKEVWRCPTKTNVFASPVIAGGVIYCGEGNAYSLSEEASFFAITAAYGKEIWKIKTGAQVWSSPLFVNGRIYFGCMDGCLYAVR